jgi:hypothetical protein
MPRHPTKKCPECDDLLRQWPQKGGPFDCRDVQCKSDNTTPWNALHFSERSKIDNTGLNRYNCFGCNIDYCLDCTNREALLDPNTKEHFTDPQVTSASPPSASLGPDDVNDPLLLKPHSGSNVSVDDDLDWEDIP